MSIADWFRPKWRNSNPDVRLKSVNGLTNISVLVDIAKNDKDSGVRKTAMERLTDIEIAWEISNGMSRLEAEIIHGRLSQSQLAEVAKTNSNADMREAAVKRLTDQKLLANVAAGGFNRYLQNLIYSGVRDELVKRLTDQKVLADIALMGPDGFVRKAALMRVTDPGVLADIVKRAKVFKDLGEVQRLAEDRIKLVIHEAPLAK